MLKDVRVRQLFDAPYRYILELKNMGAPIQYCRDRQSYYYEESFDLDF